MHLIASSIKHNLSNPTSFFGIRLWAAIIICIISALLIVLIFTLAFISWRYRRSRGRSSKHAAAPGNPEHAHSNCSMDRRLLSRNGWDVDMSLEIPEEQVMYSGQWCGNERASDGGVAVASGMGPVSQYTLMEIAEASNGLAYENVVGNGDYGVVFRGFLTDFTPVAVKSLFSKRNGRKSFMREAEAMLLIRHKNLVKLIGYCAEGNYRMLVYEYVDNGNLKQWLHHSIGNISPLTWNIRTKIIVGVAKGLAYLHEDTEPPVVHRNLKSSNILLDQQWNPKISDIGITRFLGPEWNHATAHPAGMSGYIAPEYDSTHVLDQKSDVYSFGVLIMEIVSGKASIESSVNEIEEYLVDWIKSMVALQKFDIILDPKLPELPSMKELKRILLISLRCVDCEAEKRPKMEEILHMLEPHDLLLSDEHVVKRQTSRRSFLKEDELPQVLKEAFARS